MKQLYWVIGCLCWGLLGCNSPIAVSQETIVVNTEDAVVQSILDFANRRETESILPFLAVENSMHRYVAVLSLASVQDSTTIPDLGNALYDDHAQIRWAAAFALGQTKAASAAKHLVEAFQTDTIREVRAAILEAVGRCGTMEELKYLSTTPPYPSNDSLLLYGQAMGLYRFALRGMVYEEGVRKIVVEFIANPVMSGSARLVAAAFLARAKNLSLEPYEEILLESVKKEKNPQIKQFLVVGVGKLKSITALNTLRQVYKNDLDYRVRCQVIRSMNYFNYDSAKTTVLAALGDTSIAVQEAAADYLGANGMEKDAVMYSNLGDAHPHWQVAIKLQEAALRNLSAYKLPSKQFIAYKLKGRYTTATHLYEKAAALRAMGNFTGNYRFVADQIFPKADTIIIPAVIRSAGTEALVAIRQHPDLAREWGAGYGRTLDELNALYRKVMESGDEAMMAVVAQAIADKPELYRNAFPDIQFLLDARRRLKLPRDMETDIFIQQAIAGLSGKSLPTPKADKKHFVQIDWLLVNILKEQPEVLVNTNKGSFSILLFPQQAPATTTQFVQLVKADFYTQKTFHRMVPNFVVQGGCSRGDGWGGFEVVAPSEFSALGYHDAGCVGMASAGKDTEGTQFFITHAPTPHLDGNYTLFGKVNKGMEVVHTLSVGDTILNMQLKQ